MKPVDIAIVGAGAAGLMASIWAARTASRKKEPLSILLFDTRPKIGAKILMSGGTRCNVTHQIVRPSDYQGGPSHFVKHVLEAFTPSETLAFFREIGVELVLEATGKYFPATHSAQTVLDALLRESSQRGVLLQTGIRITEIKREGDFFRLKNSDASCRPAARKVILTTGGLSYPTTGSDGTGYGIAQSFGHRVTATYPALTPLLTGDRDWKALSGVSLQARLSFYKMGKKETECGGSFLFTHFGFSGPAALDISRHYAASRPEESPGIAANFLPDYEDAKLRVKYQALQERYPRKQIKNLLADEFSLPERFAETFLGKIGIGPDEAAGRMAGEKSRRLLYHLLHYPLEVTGVFGYKKAEVTAGGLDLKEVKVQTMESKRVPGLYFAGEILDVDGRIGGFNFQWSWSSGAVAGRSAAGSLIS